MTAASKTGIVHGARVQAIATGANIISARNLELKNLIGKPYSKVSLDVKQGEVFAIRGRNGSGKTALLLTLAGRMLFTGGTLEILGYKMPLRAGKVHQRIALALFEGLNDLSDAQLVRNAVAAEFELWGRKAQKSEVDAYLHEWNLVDLSTKRIGDLSKEQLTALGVQLAWVGHPDIIVVDDIESGLTKTQSEALMQRLIHLARSRNVTILVGVLERDLAAMADNAFYLGDERSATQQQAMGGTNTMAKGA